MSFRHAVTKVAFASGALALAGGFAVLSFVGPASATAPVSGATIPTAAVAVGTYTAGTPYSSGQLIDVQVPANTALKQNVNVNILECSAPGGVIPTDPSACDGNTIQGPTIKPLADGSLDLKTQTNSYYTVYSLPNNVSLGEVNGPACNLSTQCVLYIGDDQTDFTQPHFWSQVFWVKPNGTDSGANPGDGTPEVPYAVILPIAALGVFGAGMVVRRRRSSANA